MPFHLAEQELKFKIFAK